MPEEQRANAKLMAQSPTMFLLLKEELEFLTKWIKSCECSNVASEVEDQMKERKEFIEMTLNQII